MPDLAAAHGLTVWIHPEDELLLSDPAAGLSPESKPLLEQYYGTAKPSFLPEKLEHIQEGDEVSIADIKLRVWHSPGHTPGCVVLTTDSGRLMLSGDVLFNEGVGRTDLPRSNPAAMNRGRSTMPAITCPSPLGDYFAGALGGA